MSAGQLSALARMLAPPGEPAAVVEAAPDWCFPQTLPDVPVVLWGRPPATSAGGARAAGWHAVRRVRALATVPRRAPGGRVVRGVHPLPPPALSVGVRGAVRNGLLQGAAVELSAVPARPRVIDEVLVAARVTTPPRLRVGAGGTLLATVTTATGPAVLRAAPSGTTADPQAAAAALQALSGDPRVPVLLAGSTTAGVSWTTESLARGVRPRRLSAELVAQVAGFAAGLPTSERPASAAQDLRLLEHMVPELAGQLQGLGGHLDDDLAALPGTARHGDLWSGNLLVDEGRLSAVLDWDAYRTVAVPGTDLLHLLATERRLRSGQALGAVCLERPWEWACARAAGEHYWPHVGVELDPGARRAVGISWWAGQVASDLRRTPSLAQDDRWLEQNVHAVVRALHAGL